MPCYKPEHAALHKWPLRGKLFICRCERLCGYCSKEADPFSSGAALREHVKGVHIRADNMAHVKLEKGWRGRISSELCPCESRKQQADEEMRQAAGETFDNTPKIAEKAVMGRDQASTPSSIKRERSTDGKSTSRSKTVQSETPSKKRRRTDHHGSSLAEHERRLNAILPLSLLREYTIATVEWARDNDLKREVSLMLSEALQALYKP